MLTRTMTAISAAMLALASVPAMAASHDVTPSGSTTHDTVAGEHVVSTNSDLVHARVLADGSLVIRTNAILLSPNYKAMEHDSNGENWYSLEKPYPYLIIYYQQHTHAVLVNLPMNAQQARAHKGACIKAVEQTAPMDLHGQNKTSERSPWIADGIRAYNQCGYIGFFNN